MTAFKPLLILALSGIFFPAAAQQQKDTISLIKRPADFGLIYPISTNGSDAAQYSNTVSIQGLAGLSGAVTAVGIAGIANIITRHASGTQIAGITNIIGGNAEGVQVAGIANVVKLTTKGTQIAGLLNKAESVSGAQLAGLVNLSRGNVKGIQIGGLINKGNVVHSQLAGLINKATKVKGVQISGMLNIADSSDYPIGFINLIRNGETSLGVSTDESLNTLAFFRSGGRVLYGVVGLGYNLKQTSTNLYELKTGIGAHLVRFGDTFLLNGEAAALTITDFKHGHAYKYSLSTLPELRVARSLAIFAGPAANLVLDYSGGRIASLVHHYSWTTTGKSGHFIGAYLGVTGGVAVML